MICFGNAALSQNVTIRCNIELNEELISPLMMSRSSGFLAANLKVEGGRLYESEVLETQKHLPIGREHPWFPSKEMLMNKSLDILDNYYLKYVHYFKNSLYNDYSPLWSLTFEFKDCRGEEGPLNYSRSPPTGTYASEPNQTYEIENPKDLSEIHMRLGSNEE
jgi:hypothetical protein